MKKKDSLTSTSRKVIVRIAIGAIFVFMAGLIIGSAKCEESRMGREGSPNACFGMILDKKKNKIAVFKKAITGATYKVKAETIAEKIFKECLFELVLTLYNHKYLKFRNN
jgi:hypothetical protein